MDRNSLSNITAKGGIIVVSTSSDRGTHAESHTTTDNRESSGSLVQNNENETKTDIKINVPEELQPTLDSGEF